MEKEYNQEREYWVDALKGLAMILVVAGHSGLPQQISQVIYFFHMPLLFFISGYLEKNKEKTWMDKICKRAKRLIYPYFVFGGIIVLYNTIYYYHTTDSLVKDFLKRIGALFYGNYIFENNYAYIGTLWFLVALFDVSILFYGFYKSKIKIGYCVVIGSIGFLVGEVEKRYGFRLPWCFDIALVAFLFYAAGYYYRNFTYKLVARKDMKFIMGIFLGVIGILMGFINTNYMLNNNYTMTRVDMLYLNWGSIPLFLLSGITISVSLSLISTVIFTRYRFSILENIGQNSLLIMVIHLYIIQFLSRFGKNVKIPAKPWFIFLLGLFLSVVISKLIVRKCPWLIEYSMAKKVLNDLHDKKKRG